MSHASYNIKLSTALSHLRLQYLGVPEFFGDCAVSEAVQVTPLPTYCMEVLRLARIKSTIPQVLVVINSSAVRIRTDSDLEDAEKDDKSTLFECRHLKLDSGLICALISRIRILHSPNSTS